MGNQPSSASISLKHRGSSSSLSTSKKTAKSITTTMKVAATTATTAKKAEKVAQTTDSNKAQAQKGAVTVPTNHGKQQRIPSSSVGTDERREGKGDNGREVKQDTAHNHYNTSAEQEDSDSLQLLVSGENNKNNTGTSTTTLGEAGGPLTPISDSSSEEEEGENPAAGTVEAMDLANSNKNSIPTAATTTTTITTPRMMTMKEDPQQQQEHGRIMNACIQAMKEHDWKYDIQSDLELLITGVTLSSCGEGASVTIILDVKELSDRLCIYAGIPNSPPFSPSGNQEQLERLCEYITRVNYGLPLGCFEMDCDDGHIRFKVSIDVEGGVLTSRMVRTMIGVATTTIARYQPGFVIMMNTSGEGEEENHDHEKVFTRMTPFEVCAQMEANSLSIKQ